jgi:hypothetical protein
MKNYFAFLMASLTVPIFLSPASAATKVFLLGGQSNMAGVGGYSGYIAPNTDPWSLPPYDHADAPCPAPYNQPLNAVKFWNYTPDTVGADRVHNPGVGNGWISLQNGYGYRNDQFGPELSFGHRLHDLYPNDEIYLVKLGITSTSLAGHWNPTSGALYSLFKSRVNTAVNNLVAQGKQPSIDGMIWMQGEEDSVNPAYATAYAANLDNFVLSVRNDFDTDNMKFVAGRITYMTELWTSRYNINLVRNAQMGVGNRIDNATCINTDDLEWGYYGHYGTQGQLDLGIRFANQFAVPEPSVLALAGSALLCLLVYAWRKR